MAERILLVDDEQEIADLLEVYLTSDGYEVEKFYRGKPALESMANNQFDLAVLDVMLPDIDGFQLFINKAILAFTEHRLFFIDKRHNPLYDTNRTSNLNWGNEDAICTCRIN